MNHPLNPSGKASLYGGPGIIPESFGVIHAFVRVGQAEMYQEFGSKTTPSGDGDPVGTLVNQIPLSPNPIDEWNADNNNARPIYRADAYSSGYPALEFDGVDDRVRFYNFQLAFEEIDASGYTLYVVWYPQEQNTYGTISLNGVPNQNEHSSIWQYQTVPDDGSIGMFVREEAASEVNGVHWKSGTYDYVVNPGPHVIGVSFDTVANDVQPLYGYTDKEGAHLASVSNIVTNSMHRWSTMIFGGDSWAGGASNHWQAGFLHAAILYEGIHSNSTIQALVTRIKNEWYP